MADVRLKLDPNNRNVLGLIDDSTGDVVPAYADNATGRLKVDASISSVTITDIEDGAGDSIMDAANNAIQVSIVNDGVDVLTTPLDNSINGAGAPVINSYSTASISVSADTANQTLVSSGGANTQIWVYGIQFTVGTGDGSVSFQDEDDTAITGVMPFAQKSGMVNQPSGNFAMPIWKLATDKDLEVDTVTCDIKGSIQYAIVDVS